MSDPDRITRLEFTLGTLISWLDRELGHSAVVGLLEQLQDEELHPQVKHLSRATQPPAESPARTSKEGENYDYTRNNRSPAEG